MAEAHPQDAAVGKEAKNSTATLARIGVVASVRAPSSTRVVRATGRRLGRCLRASADPFLSDAVPVRCSPLLAVDPFEGFRAKRRADRLGAPPPLDPLLV
jgi:hypothetical protein